MLHRFISQLQNWIIKNISTVGVFASHGQLTFSEQETFGWKCYVLVLWAASAEKNAAGARRGKCNRYKRLKNATSIKSKKYNQFHCNAKRKIKRRTSAKQIWTDLTYFAWRSRIVYLFHWVRYPANILFLTLLSSSTVLYAAVPYSSCVDVFPIQKWMS